LVIRDLNGAEQLYRRALATDPKNGVCGLALAFLLKEKRQCDEAEQIYRYVYTNTYITHMHAYRPCLQIHIYIHIHTYTYTHRSFLKDNAVVGRIGFHIHSYIHTFIYIYIFTQELFERQSRGSSVVGRIGWHVDRRK
jgi:hypothetical protein